MLLRYSNKFTTTTLSLSLLLSNLNHLNERNEEEEEEEEDRISVSVHSRSVDYRARGRIPNLFWNLDIFTSSSSSN
jgi:hypothetical protein